jgi:hypothetical protein
MFALWFTVLMVAGVVSLAAGTTWGLVAGVVAACFLGWKALTTNWFW